MKKIQVKIIIYLLYVILVSGCHTLDHKNSAIKPIKKITTSPKIQENIDSNNKLNSIEENISKNKLHETKKIIKKTSIRPSINKHKNKEIERFHPISILNLSEKQLFEKMGISDFIKNEGKLRNHQYYFSNCFVDIFVIKKENNYLVNFFQSRPIELNGILNEENCFKDISKKIKSLKQ